MVGEKIYGKLISSSLRSNIQNEIASLKISHPDFNPKIVIIQVGDRLDSSTYVHMKLKTYAEVGIDCELLKYPADISQHDMINTLNALNNSKSVHGILVQ